MMKIVILLCLLIALPAFGQYDGKDPGIASRFRPGFMWFNTGWRPGKNDRDRKYDRLMVDITYNDWVNDSALFLVKPPSLGYNIHGMWDIPLTKGDGLSLGIGLSYRFQHVRYDGAMLRDTLNRATQWVLGSAAPEYDKSVFASHAFAVPVELRIRIPKWRHVKLHLGGYVGYRVSTYTKVWTNDRNTIVKDHHFFDDERLLYGIHARLGIRNFAFFVDYAVSKQFQSDKSTSLQPLALGVTISLF
jgi:hypothetical protein